MKESLDFYYDGIYSIDMGVMSVNSSSGLFEEFFLPNRVITEQKASNREKPYFIKIDSEPITFDLRILIQGEATHQRLQQISQWLYKDYYKPLIFTMNPNRIFYAILEGESSMTHNGAGDMYLDITVRCDSPYAYTPEYFEENVLLKTENEENKFLIDETNFDDGEYENIEIVDGELKLIDVTIWGQFPEGTKWGDIV